MIHHANRVDIFGIGVVLMKVLLHSNDKHIELKLKLFEIIKKCVELNPYTRTTPSQLYKELNTVYK